MKKYSFLALLLTLLMLFSLMVPVASADPEQTQTEEESQPIDETEPPAWQEDPTEYREIVLSDAPEYEANCNAALLLELNSGTVVYAKNAEQTVFPASLTKIMTCMLALDYAGKHLDEKVTVSESAIAGIAEAGGDVRLQAGEQLTLRDVLYYLMVVSANEAANVVAEYVAGDIPSFVNLMNNTARELGCTGTHFANAHGLHDPDHYTTARDLSIIVRKALTNETFREIVATPTYTVEATNLSNKQVLTTTNYLILENGNRYLADNGNYYSYYYDLATGVKTGYTSAAGRCVISRATDGHMDLLCIILGADTRVMSDSSVRYDNFVEAKKLFYYGFDNFDYAKVVAKGQKPMFQVPVKYSKDKRGVVLVPAKDVNCLLPKDYDSEKLTTDYQLSDAGGLVAPLEEGQAVAQVRVFYNGTQVGSADLVTLVGVEAAGAEKVVDNVVHNSTLRRILRYWWILPAAVVGLFLVLILRNLIYRSVRRAAIKKRRQQRMQSAQDSERGRR